MDISQLVDNAHTAAQEKGFWDTIPTEETLVAQLRLFLILTEVVEAFDDLRNGHAPSDLYFEGEKPCGVPVELADTVIRIADMAGAYGWDLAALIE